MKSFPTHTETGRSNAHFDHTINVAYNTYMAESAAAYRKYVASLATVHPGRHSVAQQDKTSSDSPASRKYRAGVAAVRQAGLPAVWAAGLTAGRAAIAYWKYVAGLHAIQSSDLSDAAPTAELSNAERAAAAAAESAAAYQKYVVGSAAGGGKSDAPRTAVAPVAEQESDSPAG
jgi:hypothetical protein